MKYVDLYNYPVGKFHLQEEWNNDVRTMLSKLKTITDTSHSERLTQALEQEVDKGDEAMQAMKLEHLATFLYLKVASEEAAPTARSFMEMLEKLLRNREISVSSKALHYVRDILVRRQAEPAAS
jgi:hypothetical protein